MYTWYLTHICLNKAYHCADRWLKTMNISIASRRKQRSLAKSIVGENLVAWVHSQSDWKVERRFVKCHLCISKFDNQSIRSGGEAQTVCK